jgi:hypothetical protein
LESTNPHKERFPLFLKTKHNEIHARHFQERLELIVNNYFVHCKKLLEYHHMKTLRSMRKVNIFRCYC